MSKIVSNVARRYAKALWLASETGASEGNLTGLESLAKLLGSNHELAYLAKSPVFSADEKRKVFGKIFDKLLITKTLHQFLNLLIERNRFHLLAEIAIGFRELYLIAHRTKEAHVISAIELTPAQSNSIKSVLEAALDTKVEMINSVDESLLAGIHVFVDGRSLDASLRNNLNNLKNGLLRAEA